MRRSYATYLRSKRFPEEASYMYERAGELGEGAEAAAEALDWGRARCLAKRAGWGADKLAELGHGLASRLEVAGRGAEAATVVREWLGDPEEAVAVLARSHQWAEALRVAREEGREDLVETHVRPALLERRAVLEESAGARSAELGAMLARLEVVRRTRAAAAEGEEEEDDRNVEDADLFSDTSSVGGAPSTVRTRSSLQTRVTARSGKSGKTRRKAERRLYSTKEGSAHEDLGILAAVHELVSALPALREEVGRLFRGLAEVGEEGGAAHLQHITEVLLASATAALPVVWLEPQQEAGTRFGPEATVEDIVRGGAAGAGGAYSSPTALLPPHLRAPPLLRQDNLWKLQIL